MIEILSFEGLNESRIAEANRFVLRIDSPAVGEGGDSLDQKIKGVHIPDDGSLTLE